MASTKSFFSHIPFPLVHIDTGYKIPEMIEYRDKIAKEYKIDMIIGQNKDVIDRKQTFPEGNATRLECCKKLKTEALHNTLNGKLERYRLKHETGLYEKDQNIEPYTGVIVGIRSDEEGSRSKERYFSPRDMNNNWDVEQQPPEFWNQYKTEFAPGTNVRIHPLLDWTELDIWEYIERENIPTVSLYLDALKDEQAQGITIDIARVFFKTQKRNYIIIDAPGHIEFLKNMVTGAARADVALLVIDANEGIKENSKRHGYILSMLGIPQICVLVNKMDLVQYSEEKFREIERNYRVFLKKINVEPNAFIPVSGIKGENILENQKNMPWYQGKTVLEILDLFKSAVVEDKLPFRMHLDW